MQKRTVDRLHHKFISKYVEACARWYIRWGTRNIWEYQAKKSQGGKDLTKDGRFYEYCTAEHTDTFLLLCQAKERVPKPVNQKQAKQQEPAAPAMSHMVLNIPLIPMTPPSQSSLPLPTATDVEKPPSPPSLSSLPLPTVTDVGETAVTTVTVFIALYQPLLMWRNHRHRPPQPQLEIPANVYADLLQELRARPWFMENP